MKANDIYQTISENIIRQFSSFKEGKINKNMLNENLVLNLSSMCKFLNGKETVNNSILDVFVPVTRLEYAVSNKIRGSGKRGSNKTIDEINDEALFDQQFLLKNNENFQLVRNNQLLEKNDTLNLDMDERDNDTFNMSSLQLEKSNVEMIPDSVSAFGELLDKKSEISTIYNLEMKRKSVIGSSPGNISVFNEQSFYNFHKKLKSTSSNNVSTLNNNNNIMKEMTSPKNSIQFQKNCSSPIQTIENETYLDETSSYLNMTSGGNKENSSMSLLVKQVIEDINGELKDKAVREFIKDMNADYIKAMYEIYYKIRQECEKNKECENLIFINKFKSFVLEIGISDKKFYEQCIREIIYNKNNLKFLEFLLCFHKLIYLKFDQNFLKYKFLIHITRRKNEDFLEQNDLERFFELLKSKKIYDIELYTKISNKLVEKYKDIFPNDTKLYIRKVALVLEQFFDLK